MRAVRRLLTAVVVGATLASSAGGQDGTAPRQVTIRVVDGADGAAVPYSVIALPSLGIERFVGPSGSIVLPVVQAARVRLTVKRLGFTPKDTTIVVSDAPTQEFTVGLARLSFTLDAVSVLEWPPCMSPGIPRRGGDARVRVVVEQMQLNADRFALLARQHPFEYHAERTLGRTNAAGVDTIERVDTISLPGNPPWRYRPGTMVAGRTSKETRGGVDWTMRIPSLRDLGEDAFVDNHCFHVAGLEEKEGRELLRLDIVAAARLRTPDVNASVWLDPRDYQLRFANFVLTKVPPTLLTLRAHSSQIEFSEIIPFVPVMQMVFGESVVLDLSTVTESLIFERQRILRVEFRGARPDGLIVRPPTH